MINYVPYTIPLCLFWSFKHFWFCLSDCVCQIVFSPYYLFEIETAYYLDTPSPCMENSKCSISSSWSKFLMLRLSLTSWSCLIELGGYVWACFIFNSSFALFYSFYNLTFKCYAFIFIQLLITYNLYLLYWFIFPFFKVHVLKFIPVGVYSKSHKQIKYSWRRVHDFDGWCTLNWSVWFVDGANCFAASIRHNKSGIFEL